MQRAEAERELRIREREAEAKQAELDQLREDQKKAQEDARDNKQSGANAANMLGIGLIAAGTIMVIIGSIPPPGGNPALLPPGLFMVAGGLGAMMAGAAMNANANQNQGFATNLDSLAPINPGVTPGFNVDDGTAQGNLNQSAVDPNTGKIDPSRVTNSVELNPDDLRSGTLGEIFDTFEAKTGLNRDDFARGLLAGKTPAELLDGKANGLTKEQLQKGIDAAQSNILTGDGLNSELEKLAKEAGLDDLYANMKKGDGTDFSGGGSGASLAGGGAAPKPVDLAGILGTKGKGKDGKAGADGKSFSMDDLKNLEPPNLDRSIASQDSIFAMVSRRYQKVSKVMLGFIPNGLAPVEEGFEALEEEL